MGARTPQEQGDLESEDVPLSRLCGEAEMQVQDQRLLLTLRHLHRVLEELRAKSAHWDDATSSRGTSPIRARAGSESRGCPSISSKALAQLLRGADSRRSSLP
ncbi:uncharacterized protein C20orf202 homolog isoform X1 [Neofelis nebulosa]|uniref:uncharacterized protein C20orf202 homolog isoform X1 n=1 Tax=Neofelis nebulosa TaxID=61452 RepID=UPI002729D6E1|nr:uncharacterized protein C20orf202 homolog isoform X1 [Neofelis nebulosa]